MRILSTMVACLLIANVALSQKKEFKIGDKAPSFTATDQHGNRITLENLLKEGKVVLVFYRGNWCPYCNKHLKQLQDSLELIKSKGATLVAVSPEKSEYVAKTIEKTGATYPILYDSDLAIMNAYGVTFTVDMDVVNRYKNAGIDLMATNGGDGNKLPVPAVYVIDRNGIIAYEFFDPNYRKRASVSEILEHL